MWRHLPPDRMPIGWDFTVDREGNPVLIELDVIPGLRFQMTLGRPIFGEMTEWILDDFFLYRTLEKNQEQGLLVQY